MKNTAKWIFGFVMALLLVAISAEVLAAPTEKKRDYPGGADEEDLKVQAELPVPPRKVDRKSLEVKALQTVVKKTGSTVVVPDAPTSQAPSEEE